MASNMSIKIESIKGPIAGEYRERAGEIEVWNWSWGLSHSGTTHHGSGGGQGVLSVQDITLTKPVDKSTPELLKMAAKGTVVKEAILTVRKAGGADETIDYVKIVLKNGVISSYQAGASHGEDQMTDTFTINFPEFYYEYIVQEVAGEPGSPSRMGWNIPDKKECSL